MSLLLVPSPIFDEHMAVEAYYFEYDLYEGKKQCGPEPTRSRLLEALEIGGVDAFTGGKPIIVPVDSVMLLAELDRQCSEPPGKIVFWFEDELLDTPAYRNSMAYLRSLGYRFAATITLDSATTEEQLPQFDYLFLGQGVMHSDCRKALILRYKSQNRNLRVIATSIDTPEYFEELTAEKADLFTGKFYYLPRKLENTKIAPLKANLVHLLNVVRDENFEFSTIARIVQRDPALTFSLMRFVNSPYLGVRNKIRTIHHAVTILGQDEVRKWVTAAVFKSLGMDRPSELVRMALVRAKLAENLAPHFKLSKDSESLFLMGLFSVLDVILQTNMEAALESVLVSDEIYDALVKNEGPYHEVLNLMKDYERADWKKIHACCAERAIALDSLYQAYIGAISWYNELLTDNVRPRKD